MGAFIIAMVNVELGTYHDHRPKTPGEALDQALADQKREHDRQIRDLEQKVESARRLALMGGGW